MNNRKIRVLSVGGSLLFDSEDILAYRAGYMKWLSEVIKEACDSEEQYFSIVTGGGKIAGVCVEGMKAANASPDQQDEVGIATTHINAQVFVANLQRAGVNANYLKIPYPADYFNHRVSVTGGYKIGHTTDFVAVKIAIEAGVSQVTNLTNVHGILPVVNGELDVDHGPISVLTVSDYLDMVGNDHKPRINLPVDPIAAQLAREHDITINTMYGKDELLIRSILLDGDSFSGITLLPK